MGIMVEPDTATQLVVGCLLSFTATLLYSEFKPYLFSTDDALQLVCQLSVFLTMFSALIIKCRVNKEEAMQGAGLEAILVFLQAAPLVLGVGAAVLKLTQHARKQTAKIKRKKELIAHLRQKGEVKKILSLKKLPAIKKEKKKKTKDKKPSAISKICAKFKGKKNANQKVVPAVDDAPSDEVTDIVTKVVEPEEAEETEVATTSSVGKVEQKDTQPSTESAALTQEGNTPADSGAAVAVAPPAQAEV